MSVKRHGRVGVTHLGTFVQSLLVLLSLADARRVTLELRGPAERRTAVDAGHRRMALLVVLFELGFLHGITASCERRYPHVVCEGRRWWIGERRGAKIRESPERSRTAED